MLSTAKLISPKSGCAPVKRSMLHKLLTAGLAFSWSTLVLAHHGWSE
ncbi:MAG: hypothetical protein RJA72_486, partial [Pseudomonadota bacterium]